MDNKTRFIFVTGGVVSSLGKGIISASIGKLLQARGYKITIQKFDPYINIDPGTLNPYEHGECYVTDDGFETDLDLGHYERFTGIRTTRGNSITTGRIYKTVIDRERRGDYLGKTIQVVPHITDEIKRRMLRADDEEVYDFVITEVGGTIGDIESAPFMEAIRQLRWELGRRAVNVHLTYVPYLKAAGELKTKPTQHSVKELQGMGIQPDILVLRTEQHLSDGVRQKVASFCNVDLECVVQSEDMPSIYAVPVNMQRQGLDAAMLRKFGIPVGETPAMLPWRQFLERQQSAEREVTIGLVGKYDLQDAYKSIIESLKIAGIHLGVKVRTQFINSEEITAPSPALPEGREYIPAALSGYSLPSGRAGEGAVAGYIICPGFGQRGIEGKILAAQYCREHDIPCFGICLGMQMMVIEFARNVLGLSDANSREMDEATTNPVIDMMEEQKHIAQLGGTMRLGAYDCALAPGSRARAIYNKEQIRERHRHRYELNSRYAADMEAAGLKISGHNPQSGLAEIVEIPANRFYIGTQFHPEYSSTVLNPHPLFLGFLKAILTPALPTGGGSLTFTSEILRMSNSSIINAPSPCGEGRGGVIHFTKMHGLGNDYIYIDADRFPIEDPAAFSIKWSKPHTGIGSDGLILISKANPLSSLSSPSAPADFRMRIFNADGTEAMMCGNGSRCVGKYVYDKGLTDKTEITLETLAGIKTITLSLSPGPSPEGRGVVIGATVDMGEPTFEDETLFIPSLLKTPLPTGEGQGERLFVSMGNPHYVVFLEHIPTDEEVTRLGREMEFAEAFPQRCNIEFACPQPDGTIRMRVWERGSGITQACGTGACATAVAATVTGKAGRTSQIVMDGGTLQIEWRAADNHIYMTGPAETAFEGFITLG